MSVEWNRECYRCRPQQEVNELGPVEIGLVWCAGGAKDEHNQKDSDQDRIQQGIEMSPPVDDDPDLVGDQGQSKVE